MVRLLPWTDVPWLCGKVKSKEVEEKLLAADLRSMMSENGLLVTGPDLNVNRSRLSVGGATRIISGIRFESVGNFQLAVSATAVLRLDADAISYRVKVQQTVVLVPEDEFRRNWTLKK